MPIKLEDIPKIPNGEKFIMVEVIRKVPGENFKDYRENYVMYMTPDSFEGLPEQITFYSGLKFEGNSRPEPTDFPFDLDLNQIEKITLLESK